MITELKRNPVDQDVNPSGMVHITLEDDPYTALCGTKIRGIDAEDDEADCIVCIELEQEIRDDEE